MKQTWKPAYPIDQLEPHPDNPRRGDVEAIGESIDAHGFYGAVLVQESRGRIIAGEHRWKAAQAKGMTKLPVVLIDCDDDEAKRIMLADNKLADSAGYDDAALAALLKSLDDFDGTGYNDEDLERLSRVTAASEADWNHADAWDGMPGYESENRLAAFKVTVYFTDKADVPSFFETINREVSTRVWWPMPEEDAPSESWKQKVIVTDVG